LPWIVTKRVASRRRRGGSIAGIRRTIITVSRCAIIATKWVASAGVASVGVASAGVASAGVASVIRWGRIVAERIAVGLVFVLHLCRRFANGFRTWRAVAGWSASAEQALQQRSANAAGNRF
jgi:hypothetical protein